MQGLPWQISGFMVIRADSNSFILVTVKDLGNSWHLDLVQQIGVSIQHIEQLHQG